MMKYLEKKQEQNKAPSPCLPRHALPTTATPSPICLLLEAIDHIKVGSYYEINHSKLPPRTTPEQLKAVRVVMVSEKGALKVALRFPSIHSLHTHITEGGYAKPLAKQIPALNEKYVMPAEMASEVLYRRIPPQEIADRSNIWSFWAATPSATNYQRISSSPSPAVSGEVMNRSVVSKKGPCWSELKFTGMVTWGKRRQVRYMRRHEPSPSSSTDEEEETGEELTELEENGDDFYVDDENAITVIEEDDDIEEEEEDVKTEDEAPPVVPWKMNLRSRKRKSQDHHRKPKKTTNKSKSITKRQKQNQVVAVPDRSNKKLVKQTVARWSAGRYKAAEENMLRVMKAKGAKFGSPILRPALRSEARKLIGDTGLLDHLLKHMAGKVAPGGAERFRRRHNADGAMEYWLESADLFDIRKEAGVQDPYWTPPPGWGPGDNPTRDPICTREIHELKEEITKIKRVLHVSKNKEDNLALVTTSNSCLTSLDWEHDGSLIHQKEEHAEQIVKKTKMEEQLMDVSQSLSEMKEQIGMLKSSREEPLIISDAPPPPDTDQRAATKSKGGEQEEEEDKLEGGDNNAAATATHEDKAAKIQRLRSGFRICRPQGSFLWPNMGISTPPSASSSSATHLIPIPPQPQPGSPVKPVAERRPVKTATLCNVSYKPSASPPIFLPPGPPSKSKRSVTVTNTLLINLNELPNPNPNSLQNASETSTALSGTLTYQRRHHHQQYPHMLKAKTEDGEDGNASNESSKQQQHDEPTRWCSSSSPSTTAKWMGHKW
ncbi:protein DYAD [Prunus persica]|uniref:protein DYAD n=1 Tax=Prunus persica TaxID=3760 RepID=UPI0009ABA7FD|nr:protein DYAD [Prunus persica]